MNIQTADLSRRARGQARRRRPHVRQLRRPPVLRGPIATLKIFEDNSFVRKALEGPGNGRVLVIDGGA